MGSMSLPILTKLGLSPNEAEIYDFLLNRGELPVYKIIEELDIKRPTVYKCLNDLVKRGLVAKEDRNKILHFRPLSPNNLVELAERQLDTSRQTKAELSSLLPSLSSTFTLTVERPVIQTFQGIESVKEIYLDTIREGKPIYAALTTAAVEPKLFDWLTKKYAKMRIEAGIHAEVIVSTGEWSGAYAQLDEEELRETRLVPQEKYPFEHEIDIYGDKVAFIDYKKDSKLIGIIINHPAIARSQLAMWKLAWEGAKLKTA